MNKTKYIPAALLGLKWEKMQHEKDLTGDVVLNIWKSKKVAWHWIALYRRPIKNTNLGVRSTYGRIYISWNFRGRGYKLLFMEWLGFPRKYRWFRP